MINAKDTQIASSSKVKWPLVSGVLLVVLVALAASLLWPSSVAIPDKTLRVGLVTQQTYAPTTLLANLLSYPVEASDSIAVAERRPIEQLVANLGLSPVQSADDRTTLSTTLGLDILLLLDAAPLSDSEYQVSVAGVLMPANQYLFEVNRTVKNDALGEGVAAMGTQITELLLNAIDQPGAAPDLSYLDKSAIPALNVYVGPSISTSKSSNALLRSL